MKNHLTLINSRLKIILSYHILVMNLQNTSGSGAKPEFFATLEDDYFCACGWQLCGGAKCLQIFSVGIRHLVKKAKPKLELRILRKVE